MAGLSRAAKGQKRGVLERLVELPSPIMNMATTGDERLTPAMVTISLVVAAITIVVGVLTGLITSFLFFSTLSIPFGLAMASTQISLLDREKFYVTDGLRRAAIDSVNGHDVSISEYIVQERSEWRQSNAQHLESLSDRQQRWIAKRWEKEFNKAVEKKAEKRRLAATPARNVAKSLDALLDKDKLREIHYHEKALKELTTHHSQSAQTAEEKLDSEFKKLTSN